jgi:hypothetical protein
MPGEFFQIFVFDFLSLRLPPRKVRIVLKVSKKGLSVGGGEKKKGTIVPVMQVK